jgi:hypothetical protein
MQTTKTTFWASAAGIAVGTGTLACTVPTGHLGGAVVGATAIVLSAMAASVQVVLTQLTKTAHERAQLNDERLIYIAAQAGIENERARIRQGLADGEKATARLLEAERAAMWRQFEEEKFKVQKDAVRVGILLERSGALGLDDAALENVLQFPIRVPAVPGQQNGTSLN